MSKPKSYEISYFTPQNEERKIDIVEGKHFRNLALDDLQEREAFEIVVKEL